MNKGCFTKKNAKKMGLRGGQKVLRKYGKGHYKKIGILAAAKRWNKKV